MGANVDAIEARQESCTTQCILAVRHPLLLHFHEVAKLIRHNVAASGVDEERHRVCSEIEATVARLRRVPIPSQENWDLPMRLKRRSQCAQPLAAALHCQHRLNVDAA